MRGYLFDTMVHMVACNSIPEKWRRQWKEATVGNKSLLLFEPLIAEIFYQLTRQKGESAAVNRILWLKGLPTITMVKLDDNIAMDAGRFRRRREFNISLVDAFALAISKKKRAELFTTDHGIRDAGKKIGVNVNYLPKEALSP